MSGVAGSNREVLKVVKIAFTLKNISKPAEINGQTSKLQNAALIMFPI